MACGSHVCQRIGTKLAIVIKHGHHRQFLFLIGLSLKKSSPLKPLGQMNQNLGGSILGMSSIAIANLVPIVDKHGCHRPFLFLIGRF
jgi:hypothetical protein